MTKFLLQFDYLKVFWDVSPVMSPANNPITSFWIMSMIGEALRFVFKFDPDSLYLPTRFQRGAAVWKRTLDPFDFQAPFFRQLRKEVNHSSFVLWSILKRC